MYYNTTTLFMIKQNIMIYVFIKYKYAQQHSIRGQITISTFDIIIIIIILYIIIIIIIPELLTGQRRRTFFYYSKYFISFFLINRMYCSESKFDRRRCFVPSRNSEPTREIHIFFFRIPILIESLDRSVFRTRWKL